MKRHLVEPTALLHLLILVVCTDRVLGANDLTLNVPLPSQSVTVGDAVTVTLDLSNLFQPINGVQVFVQFDPARLALVDIAPNTTAGDLGSGWIVGQEAVVAGDITYIVALFGDSTMADSRVATFTFMALAAGTTQVGFDLASEVPSKLTGVDNATIFPPLLDSEVIVISSAGTAPTIDTVETFYAGKFLDAPDPSRECLAVGTTALDRNITNYVRGITGIRVGFTDVVDFALTPADAFSFEWTTGTGTTFAPISVPPGTVSVTAVDGGGVTTVDIVFDDDLIRRRWLKVIVDASQISTAGALLDGELQDNPLLMPSGDGNAGGDAVFFLGNMPGDVDGDGITLFSDAVQTRVQLNAFLPVTIENVFDLDKSGLVLFSDAVHARVQLNAFFTLPLISP